MGPGCFAEQGANLDKTMQLRVKNQRGMDGAHLDKTMQLRARAELRLFMLWPLLSIKLATTFYLAVHTESNLAVHRRNRLCHTTQVTRVAFQ